MDDFWDQTSPVCDNVPGQDLHFGYNPVHAPPSYMSGHLSAFSMVNGTGPGAASNGVGPLTICATNNGANSSANAVTNNVNNGVNNGLNSSLNSSQMPGDPMQTSEEITVTPALQTSYSDSVGSECGMDGNSMDSTRQIDCEVLIDESPGANQTVNIKPETMRQHQLMQRKTNYKVNIAKYHQVTKRELSTLIAKKDPGIHYTEVKSRKSELVNNYNRINYGDKETEFVQCLNCKDLLCYSSYDGTTSVTRHLACCPKRNPMLAVEAPQTQIVLRKRSPVVTAPKEPAYQPANHAIKTQPNSAAKPSQIIYLKQVPPAQPNIVTNIKPFQFSYSKQANANPPAKPAQQPAKILIRQVYPNNPCKNNTQLVKCNENVRKALSRTATKTIYSCLLPFDFFEDKGMKALAQKLVSIGAQFGNIDLEQGVLPTADETKKALTEFVDKIQKNLKTELDNLDSITLLIDDYKCKQTQDKFSVLAVQYTKSGCLKNRVLAIKLSNPTALTSGETIFDSIDKLISDTGASKTACSTNSPKQFKDYLDIYDLNDTEIVTSVKRREHFNEEDFNKLIWLDCSVNQLNQILESMITSLDYEPTVREIHHFHQKCSSVLDWFKVHGDAASQAAIAATDDQDSTKMGHERFFLVLDLLKQNEEKTTSEEGLMSILTQVDLGLMGRVRSVLNSFYDAKKFISCENSATINLILPCYKKLVLVLNSDNETDYRVKSFKTLLTSLLDKYFVVTDKHKIATFLTPRFRSLRNLCTPDETKALIRKIKLEFNEEKTETATANREEDGNFFNEFCTNVEDIGDEVDNYLKFSLSNADLADDPLKFWQRNKSSFVKLSEYANDILSVPASSTGFAEKLFARNNLDNLAKRSLIQASLNDYLFVNSNLDLLE